MDAEPGREQKSSNLCKNDCMVDDTNGHVARQRKEGGVLFPDSQTLGTSPPESYREEKEGIRTGGQGEAMTGLHVSKCTVSLSTHGQP